MNEKLFDYIAVCPTAFHTCAHSADMLRESGYTELCEAQRWEIVPGGKYFVTRNGSSLIAFRVPAGEIAGFMMTAAHGDSPAFKIKENADFCPCGSRISKIILYINITPITSKHIFKCYNKVNFIFK